MGIVVSLGPALRVILGPVFTWLARLWTRFVYPAVSAVVRRAAEPSGWALAFYIVAAAGRLPDGEGAARQAAALGCALAALLGYGRCVGARGSKRTDPEAASNVWAASYLASVAVAYDFHTAGFFAVMATYAAIGFIAAPVPFGYVVGFRSSAAAARSGVASVVILALYLGAKATGAVPAAVLKPFSEGASVFGGELCVS